MTQRLKPGDSARRWTPVMFLSHTYRHWTERETVRDETWVPTVSKVGETKGCRERIWKSFFLVWVRAVNVRIKPGCWEKPTFTHSHIHSFIHVVTYPSIHPLTYITYSPIHSFIHSLIDLFLPTNAYYDFDVSGGVCKLI
jgi:hypothetical protein